MMGEFGRGAAIFAGFAGVFGAAAIGSFIPLNIDLRTGAALMLVCMSGMLAIEIFSIVDADRVAKVNFSPFRRKIKIPVEIPAFWLLRQGVLPYLRFVFNNRCI